MQDAIRERAERAIGEHVFPGCVIGISAAGKRRIFPFGRFTYEADSPEVGAETVYDLASITKSIPTASLAALLIQDGTLRLNDPIVRYVPRLRNDYGTTVEDLLRYRVQGVQMSTLHFNTFEEIRTHALERGFDAAPGVSIYTNLPAFILGIVIERVSGTSLQALAHERLFAPLSMDTATFFPHADDCAPTELDDRGVVRGLPHDESAYVCAKARRAVGHAGLFSDAADLLAFLEGVMRDDRFHAVRSFAERGLGWQLDEPWMGSVRSPLSFGKTGFTGTSCVADVEHNLAVVILSNRTYPQRPVDMDAIRRFRADMSDLIWPRLESSEVKPRH